MNIYIIPCPNDGLIVWACSHPEVVDRDIIELVVEPQAVVVDVDVACTHKA